jgi:hypothetical protein
MAAGFVVAQEHISLPTQDGGLLYADVYGRGERVVVLAHGGQFDKGSWEKQARARATANGRGGLRFWLRDIPFSLGWNDWHAAFIHFFTIRICGQVHN